MPDEAKPTISISFVDGTVKTYGKWSNDKDAAFDKAYQALLDLVKLDGLQMSKCTYDGKLRG